MGKNLSSGLYEQVITKGIVEELSEIPSEQKATEKIDKAEAPAVLSQYIAEVIKKGLTRVADQGGGLEEQIALANRIVGQIQERTGDEDFAALSVDERAEQLLALLDSKDARLAMKQTAKDVVRPETSVSRSSLFTGERDEPQMYSELKKEIVTADQIDMLVSFVKFSGLRLIIDDLRAFTERGGKLRVITTSYMGATDLKAVVELEKLQNTEVKISYDTTRTRLHAKTYVFYRDTGFTTAYIGSSNLSNAAMTSGLEWNLKITASDQPDTLRKIKATFDSYWYEQEFEPYCAADENRLRDALNMERRLDSEDERSLAFDIRPYSYQKEILDRLQADREVRHQYRNLVVAATGTGKTVISAFDYRRYVLAHPSRPNRLLFVAHREEILKQSRDTFQYVLKDMNFGSLFVGKYRPDQMDHLFVSVQTLNSQALWNHLEPDFYDFIVVDEFHHAAAPTYRKLLDYFKPKILLGLTATPERMDGKNITDYFGGRVSAEIRLPEAIDRKLLCPFQYFGVTDTVDLSELRWTRGGYEKSELSNLYSMNRAVAERRVRNIIGSLDRYVTDIDGIKGLGFCVSIEHAKFMAEAFNQAGIPSIYLVGASEETDRSNAKSMLVNGKIRFIFVVDIYNEGVDIPEVNTILFLRPTESLTIFLQQLGRGLRLSEGKDCLTVLDYIGQANRKYNFEEKFAALLDNTRHSVRSELRNGFVSVPKGCFIQLEKKAAEYVLDNVKRAFSQKSGLIDRIQTFEEDSGEKLNLANFLTYYHLDPRSIYAKFSFARLSVLAGVRPDFKESVEDTLTKAFCHIVSIDSRRWISFLIDVLPKIADIDLNTLSGAEKRMLRMFCMTVWGSAEENLDSDMMLGNLFELADSPVMLSELLELLHYRFETIDFIDEPVNLGFDCPLDLHCTYTRDQLLTAMDFFKPSTVREGVKYLDEKKIDVFFITLNKSDKDYSPTTMYEDYSLSDNLFHWQSQSTTAENSKTGQRYIHHRELGSRVVLFVREKKMDSAGAAPYTFLGTARYVSHTGSKPMSIIWQLDRPIPAKYLKKTNRLAG